MRIWGIASTLAVLAFLPAVARTQDAPAKPPAASAVIRGRVIAADTSLPLRQATVTLRAPAPEPGRVPLHIAVATDAAGRFEFIELAPGRYTLEANKGTYVKRAWGQNRPTDTGTAIDVKEAEIRGDIAIALWRGGVVSGRVLDEAGGPVADVDINVDRIGFKDGVRQPINVAYAITDDRGEFRSFGLPPGKYLIRAVERRVDDSELPVWYPGTIVQSDAVAVPVVATRETSGLVINLVSAKKRRVTGTAVDKDGHPMTSFAVIATERLGQRTTEQTTRPDGTFRIDLPPGRYRLRAVPRSPSGGATNDDPAIGFVTVGDDDISGIVLTATAGRRISGRVQFEGSAAPDVALVPVRVRIRSQLEAAWAGEDAITPGAVKTDGAFEVQDVRTPGLLRPEEPLPPGWFLKSVTFRDSDVTDTPIDVKEDVTGVVVTLTRQVTRIQGQVTDDKRKPVSDYAVIVFSDDESRWTVGTRYVMTARPDLAGRFVVSGLPPGQEYLAVAVDHLEKGQETDPEFLRSLRKSAERVTLQEGETKPVALVLTRLE